MAKDIRFGAACGGIVLACAIAAASAGQSPAWADGVAGGACCADLEERIAELEATTVRKGNRRVSLTLSGQVTRSLLYWNDGDQHDVYSVDNGLNTSRFRLVGSAKINPEYSAGFLFEVDMRIGSRSNQVTQIDDDGFSGAGGIIGGPFSDGIGGAGDSVLGIRQAAWWVESKSLGKVTVGRLNSSTAGISTIDLSGAGVVITSDPGQYQGSFLMRNGLGRLGSSWSLQCGGPSGAGPYSSDCFEHSTSRRDGIRYDTPTFWGATLSGTFGEDDFYDVALRWAGEIGSFRVAAGAGYRIFRDREPDLGFPPGGPFIDKFGDTDRRQFLTSASILHVPTGLFVSGAYVNYDFRGINPNERFPGPDGDHRPDIPMWWVDAGIMKNWTGWGNTTFYGEWGRFDDGQVGLLASVAFPGLGPVGGGGFDPGTFVVASDVTWWGAGVVQTVDAAAMDFYLAYRHYEASATISGGGDNQIPGGLNGIWFIQAGARIQF
jgi:hypothetical protein